MIKAGMTLTAITLASVLGFAKPLAKMEVVCVANEKQDTIRTVYLTADKTPLLADPLSNLLIVDSVQQPTNDTVVLSAATDDGTEALSVKNTGEAALSITGKTGTTNFTMKCYANGVMQGLKL
jgi:hypothetical protein